MMILFKIYNYAHNKTPDYECMKLQSVVYYKVINIYV